jgi:hypothetical protein
MGENFLLKEDSSASPGQEEDTTLILQFFLLNRKVVLEQTCYHSLHRQSKVYSLVTLFEKFNSSHLDFFPSWSIIAESLLKPFSAKVFSGSIHFQNESFPNTESI